MKREKFDSIKMRILYVLKAHNGKAKAETIMGETGMCLGMFYGNVNELIKKGLIKRGGKFEYMLTREGKSFAEEVL